MPQPVLYGPPSALAFREGSGKRPSKANVELVESAAGDAVGREQVQAAKLRIQQIEKRAAKNKRGLSPRAAAEIAERKKFISDVETGTSRAAQDVARRKASNARAAEAAKKKAAGTAGNPVKKATKKATKKA